MLSRMPSTEITAWQEFFKVRKDRMEEAQKQAKYDRQFE